MSTITEQFSRFANAYNHYNIIQEKVAQTLIDKLVAKSKKCDYKSILDVGCGEGEIFKKLLKKRIFSQHFFALDASSNMLKLHPSNNNIIKINANFNTDFSTQLPFKNIDVVLSSSALQWSQNLDNTLQILSTLSTQYYYAIFTSNTFKTLHKTAEVTSPIHSKEVLQEKILAYHPHTIFEIKNYRLAFESTRQMLQYIKRSGVSSGEKKLSYLQTKQLIQASPLDYLEFEVLFVVVNDD